MSLTVVPVTGGATSTIVAGSVTAPPINRVLCDSGALPATPGGSTPYMVSVISGQLGTPDANFGNIFVNVGGTVAANIVSGGITIGAVTSFPATASGGSPQRFRVNLTAGQHVLVCVGNTAGGASAVYAAGMTITRLSDAYGAI